ncbi:GNAT family N-acetyltransferase [Culicoidibacter larvae]|uniref:GNAT family N-acetyltransferase n=2 Tax=Culicoidibacter larvae TaxID=2579976 RepID=A0A5R8QD40_9FIRM|nr:GNAT family N-acetyltransferase [Culicoidibacter larvae]
MTTTLFSNFIRHQQVEAAWRKVEGRWQVMPVVFVDDWNSNDYRVLVEHLKNTLLTGGMVYGAFADGVLKGFASIEANPLGSKREYRDLTSLHVSEDMRGYGVGRRLFAMAAAWAKVQGAAKLYISAHSAVETQAFYKAMGCVEAAEYNRQHVEAEPFDCQLEYVIEEG